MTLTIVIPAYNEARRLPQTLRRIAEYFSQPDAPKLQEVIIVDDGSHDGTAACANEANGSLPLCVLVHPENRGKGAAVRTGMLAATGEFTVFYDADGATPPEEIGRLLSTMQTTGADVVIGSRVNDGGEIVTMSGGRRFIGRVYHALCSPLVPGILDTACGCKLFRLDVAKRLFSLQRIDRFAFDVEILFLARKLGYRTVEVPVTWTAVGESKVRLVRDGLNMFMSVLRLYGVWLSGVSGE